MGLALLVLLWALACAPQAPAIPPAACAALDAAALALAKAGWVDESKHVAAILAELGYAEAMRTKLDAAIVRESSKVKVAADAVPEAAKKLESAARQLAALLPKREGEARLELARRILVLDSEIDEAHAALGHTKVGSSWATPEERATLERRLEIDRVRRQVAKLEIEIEQGESQDELLTKICGRPGVLARRGSHVVHSALDAEKTVRLLREAERALAFSAYLRRGEVQATPAKSGPLAQSVTLLFDTREHYLAAIDAWVAEGKLKPEEAALMRDLNSASDGKTRMLFAPVVDARLESALLSLYSPLDEGVQTTLTAGHLNWISMAYLGSPLPTFVYEESSESVFHRGGTGIAESSAARRQREERWKLSRAGIAGCRAWMAWLAERGEDPRWEESFEDQIGKVRGEILLKTTSVVEFLQETGRFAPLVKASSKAGEAKPKAVYEAALALSLAELESEWRSWILPGAKGLAQRVEKSAPDVPTPEEKAVLAALNGVRALAFQHVVQAAPDVGVERSLSEGARLHAIYLGQNPEEARKWPDAHGENADHAEFTPEGAIAGGMSVVAFDLEQPEDAIDDWMATFYHRLPLLEPGLLRIGFGWESDVAVMDVASLWAPPDGTWAIVWPYEGMKSVPLAFNAELPNPVPEVDSATLGYPITLQVGLPEPGRPPISVEMKLELEGKEVPCYLSTPDSPTNVELAPRNAFCLMPKTALQPGKLYTATATWKDSGRKLVWSFRT
jgi:polyhydroxyalkanoate synthesis regulator phasin